MALPTVASIKAAFPEFGPCPAAVLQEKIDEATNRLDDAVWAEHYDQGVKWLALHLAALSPFGQGARMVNKEGGTTYGSQFELLEKSVAFGFSVAGDYRREPVL